MTDGIWRCPVCGTGTPGRHYEACRGTATPARVTYTVRLPRAGAKGRPGGWCIVSRAQSLDEARGTALRYRCNGHDRVAVFTALGSLVEVSS